MIASQWVLCRRGGVKSLTVFFMTLHFVCAASPTFPRQCAVVKCPLDSCKDAPVVYEHECCGKQQICSCYHNATSTFHSLKSQWLSSDCSDECTCKQKLDSSYRSVLTSECKPIRCPMLQRKCRPGYERCCNSCRTTNKANKCYSKTLKKEFKSGETWKESPCRRCRCNFGETRCSQKECFKLRCPGGLTPKALQGHCCPSYCRNDTSLVRPFQSCSVKGEIETHDNGAISRPHWPCSPYQCVCRHGAWECDPATHACPTICLENRTIQFGYSDQCCKLCAGAKACIDDDERVRVAGELWMDGATRRQCGCVHGVVACLSSSITENLRPTSIQLLDGTRRVTSIIMPTVLGLVVFIIVTAGLSYFVIRRQHHWNLPISRLRQTRKRSPKHSGSHNSSDKVTPTSLHFSNQGTDEVLLVRPGIANSNEKVEALLP